MEQEHMAGFRDRTAAWCKHAEAQLARVPVKLQVIGALLLLAGFFTAVYTAIGNRDSTLRLKVQHSFRSGEMQVFIDDDRFYSGKLIGASKKKLLFGESVQGNLSETLQVPSGSHRIRVRMASDDGTVQEDSINGDFARNSGRTLLVTARHSDIGLNWQGALASPPDPPPASSGWFTRYASTLLLTAAGSIISALTGYAVRELPGHLRARQTAGNKFPDGTAGN